MKKHAIDMDQDEETFSFSIMACPPSSLPAGDPAFEFHSSTKLSFPRRRPITSSSNCPLLVHSSPPKDTAEPSGQRAGPKLTKRVSFQLAVDAGSSPVMTGRALRKVRIGGRSGGASAPQTGKEEAERRWRLFGSLMSACRNCHALEPHQARSWSS